MSVLSRRSVLAGAAGLAGSAFLPLAQRYSTDWYAFLHEPPESGRQVLEFKVEDLVPAHVERATITGFFFHLDVPAGVSASAGKRYLRLRLGTAPEVAFDLDDDIRVAQPHPVAGGRAEHVGIGRTRDFNRHREPPSPPH